jgi:hypothetical protein
LEPLQQNAALDGETPALQSFMNPYWKLAPSPPTPLDEICPCDDVTPIVLCAKATPNPLSCARCNLEVPPERIGFAAALADQVAGWRDFHDSFYHLWLDSGEFEAWAAAQLTNPTSVVNERGVALARQLSAWRTCFLWWFVADAESAPPDSCPRCQATLQTLFRGERPANGSLRVCTACFVAVAV